MPVQVVCGACLKLNFNFAESTVCLWTVYHIKNVSKLYYVFCHSFSSPFWHVVYLVLLLVSLLPVCVLTVLCVSVTSPLCAV